MIKEIKLKKTQKGKKHKRKLNRKNSISKSDKHTKKHNFAIKKNKNNIVKSNNLQEGGNKNTQKEKFEVKRLEDIDYSQFSLSRYMKADINWGSAPGPPPMDCCIM